MRKPSTSSGLYSVGRSVLFIFIPMRHQVTSLWQILTWLQWSIGWFHSRFEIQVLVLGDLSSNQVICFKIDKFAALLRINNDY